MNLTPIDVQLETLPKSAGVYKFFDKTGGVLYIGKAKNLKKRVRSYFNQSQTNFKANLLVKQIFRIKNIVVET